MRTTSRRRFVGSQLADVMSPQVAAGTPTNVMLTPRSKEFAVSRPISVLGTSLPFSSGAWAGANDPVAVEFWIAEPITVYQLGWQNGSGTMTDSVDVGIYDTSWVRKISTTGTARSGVSSLQFVDVADTVLAAGRYRLAMASNGTTANNSQHWPGPANAVAWGMLGLFDSTTAAYPLPDPLTNMATAATFTFCPVMCIAARTLV